MAISDLFGAREQMKDAALYFNPLSVDEITSACSSLWFGEDIRSSLLNAMLLHPVSEFDARTSDSLTGLLERIRKESSQLVSQ
jgi:ABC-type uncharacterized transport system permease subunit